VAALSVVELTRALVDIDSTTGREGAACAWLSGYMRRRGFAVREQPLDEGRANLLAFLDPQPLVVLSTHIDCVPPFFPSRIDGGTLYGRGACDAKGALAAQLTAVERLREKGETRVGLLFVVGEERGSDGAAAADTIAPGSVFLVDGEPTDGRLGLGTRGVLRLRLRAEGRAAHSSQPDRGVSAIDRLLDALVALREVELPEDPQLGRTFYSIGLISGGVAPNVISPSAEAEVLFRTIGPGEEILALLGSVRRLVAIDVVLEVPPVRLHTVPGFDTAGFAFTTDIPLLARWGTPLLYGPGSILDAHTDDEHVDIVDLDAAAVAYEGIAARLLAETPSVSR
jgi:acetylornithine deacetylase